MTGTFYTHYVLPPTTVYYTAYPSGTPQYSAGYSTLPLTRKWLPPSIHIMYCPLPQCTTQHTLVALLSAQRDTVHCHSLVNDWHLLHTLCTASYHSVLQSTPWWSSIISRMQNTANDPPSTHSVIQLNLCIVNTLLLFFHVFTSSITITIVYTPDQCQLYPWQM